MTSVDVLNTGDEEFITKHYLSLTDPSLFHLCVVNCALSLRIFIVNKR